MLQPRKQQGHHHNGDQAARRPHVMCSICVRRFATPRFEGNGCRGLVHSIARPWDSVSSPSTPFFSYLAGSKSVSAHPLTHQAVRPGYDTSYLSRSCSFVERQKLKPIEHLISDMTTFCWFFERHLKWSLLFQNSFF